MIRRSFKWLSLAITLLIAIAWVGSAWYTHASWFIWDNRESYSPALISGRVSWQHEIQSPVPSPDPEDFWRRFVFLPTRHPHAELNWAFDWGRQYSPFPSAATTQYAIPLYAPLILAAAITIRSWLRFFRRAKPGHCRHCRYSLSGLAPNSPCPECGQAPRASKNP